MVKILISGFMLIITVALRGATITIPAPLLDIPFELSTSDTIKDKSGVFIGKLKDGVIYKRGDISVVDFSGICDYIKMSSPSSGAYIDINNSILASGKVSFSIWFKIDLASNPSQLLELISNGNVTIVSLETKKLSGGSFDGISISFPTLTGENRGFISNYQVFRMKKWEHLIISIDTIKGKIYIYKNGLFYMSANVEKGPFLAMPNRLWIGRNKDGTKGLVGSMDEIKIFNKTFTVNEAKLLYQNEKKYLDYAGKQASCSKKDCSLKRIVSSSPIGDIFGKIVFTSKTFTYECVSDIVERGSCQFENSKIDFNSTKYKSKGAYINTFEGGNLAEIAKIASAESYANKIMSGWKGFCVDGVEEDFSWANDPYFWSSIALSALSAGIGSGSSTAATAGAKATATGAAKVGASTAGKITAATLVKEGAKNAIKTSLTETLKKKLVDNMAQYAICAAQAGLDLAKIASAKDSIPCDPVDQICKSKDKSFDQQTYSLTKQNYEDMLIENPDYTDYINVIREIDGMVMYNIVYKNIDSNLNTKDFEQAISKMKNKLKTIQQVMVGLSAAGCLYSGTVNTTTAKNSAAPTGEDAIALAVGTVANVACGPLCGAAAQVVVKFATSFSSINTCTNEKDADAKGSRHSATKKALDMKLCRKIKDTCVTKSKVGNGCQLTGHTFCCYDTVLTKTLAEQVKAQLAINWTHCTGISLGEFMKINYSPCKDTSGIDGTTLPYYAKHSDRIKAFQKVDDCIDYTEYVKHIKDLTNGEINIDTESLINQDNSYQECR